MTKSTQPKSTTRYIDTALSVLSRSEVIPLEREGVKKAQQFIIKLSGTQAAITPRLILDVHRVGFGFIFPKWAGKFRTIDVTVGEYEPPHYSRIPELIQNLCNDLAERLHQLPSPKNEEIFLAEVISLLAWFQHQFVWIHPFKDYNGRVARLLTNLLAINIGLPILTIKAETGRDRERYIKALKASDKQDYHKLEKLIANALKESFEKV